MAKEWSQFLQQQAEAQNSIMPSWRNAASDCMESQTTSQLPQHQFVNHGLCRSGADGRDYAALSSPDVVQFGSSVNLLPSQLPGRDIFQAHQNEIEYQRQNRATTAQLLSSAQQLSILQSKDNHHTVFDIMDGLSLQAQSKVVSPLSMSTSCGRIQAPSMHAGGIPSSNSACQSPAGSAKYSNIVSGAMTAKNPASTRIDGNSELGACYNDILSCTPTGQNRTNVGIDHKLAARYNDAALGIGRSQNHGLDRKLAANYNDILSGTRTSLNRVGAGANCNGYNDILNVQDSKLASSWLASGGSQDLSPEEKEMVYRAAAMQPIDMNPVSSTSTAETEVDKPKPRRNVRISKDPQSIAARQRRQRISSKMRVLQKLVPGGIKMDTASMLEEAAQYLKFLKAEVEKMEAIEQLINVAKGHLECKLGQAPSTLSASKPKSTLNNLSLIPSGPQGSLLCNPPSSQYPHYLNQASLTF